MHLVMIFISNLLVIGGASFLIAALIPVRKLILLLHPGATRQRWNSLVAMIVLFLLGYLGYLLTQWNVRGEISELLVPVVFFFGGWFVNLVGVLSLQTTLDIRHVAELERESITDPLTHLFNRRYMERRLGEELDRTQRCGFSLAVLLLDVDCLKEINDTYGHLAGDFALVHLGELISAEIRGGDIAARYGGDEFIVIAPNTSAKDAAQLAEGIRRVVAGAYWVLSDEDFQDQKIHCTVSIGVASTDEQVTCMCTLIGNADEALYQAKDQGRNRVITWYPAPMLESIGELRAVND